MHVVRARAFTMVEVLVVIALIGLLAAAASPSFVQLMRDRRVSLAAMDVAGMVRGARSRALGRGNAVMVRWTAATQSIEVREAVRADPVRPVLVASCLATDWASASESRFVTAFRAGVTPHELSRLELLDEAGGAQAIAEVCFTPRGRTFVRYAGGGAFSPMTGVARVKVTNTHTGLAREVMIPPSGAARLAL